MWSKTLSGTRNCVVLAFCSYMIHAVCIRGGLFDLRRDRKVITSKVNREVAVL